MKYDDFKMPVFGVGPIYVLTCLLLTIMGLFLNFKGFLSLGECEKGKIFFIALGIVLILFGLYLWIKAVLIEKINVKVKENQLITSGVYRIVRNPVYTAFISLFTGILLLARNYILLILPLVFWTFLTILMKNTEEKWLKDRFGEEYEKYCREVNRVIPWIRRKNS